MDAKSQVMEAQAWIGEIEARILGEEEDVSMVMEVDQAERLLDRHWELKIEVEECSEACREILDELAEVGRRLVRTLMRLCHPRIQGASLIFLQLFNECVLHLCEEGGVEFVPFSCFQVCLLEHGRLAKDVN